MRLNERELALFAGSAADRDGRMYYKHLSHGSGGVSREGESCRRTNMTNIVLV